MSLLSIFLTSLALVTLALPTVVKTAELTPENFESSVAHGLWFIEHFSPYCHHCQAFAPTWEKLVKDAETEIPSVNLAQINCILYGDLCNQNEIKAYPTMLMFKDGKIIDQYPSRGSRDLDDLKKYLSEHVKRDTKPQEPPEPPAYVHTPNHTPSPPLNPTGEVLPLTSKTFHAALEQGPTFVKFFAPWCGHCKKLAPIWKQLARHMQDKVQIAEVNCDDEAALCKSNDIQGYPTLVYFSNGARSEYSGGRKIDQLKAFAAKASSDSIQYVTKLEELEQHVLAEQVVYLLVHDPADTEIVQIIRRDAAVLLGSPKVYATSSYNIRHEYPIPDNAPWALIALKDHDVNTPVSILHGSQAATHEGLQAWFLSHRLPGSLELTQDTFQSVMNAPHSPLVVIAASNLHLTDKISERIRDISKKWRARTEGSGEYKGREVIFTWMDGERWKDWMKSMYGVETEDDEDDLDDVPVVIADHTSLIYYDEDKSGKDLKLKSSGNLFAALEDAISGNLKYKNSENIVERLARYLNTKMTSLEHYIIDYPFRFVFFLISTVLIIFFVLFRWFGDERGQYERVKMTRID